MSSLVWKVVLESSGLSADGRNNKGRRVTYIPGWDCHGLPIELRALRESSKLDLSPLEIRRTARALATRTIEEQTAGFRSYGVAGDWSRRWTTMDAAYEVAQLRVFRRMVQRGLIYRRFKPVYWSPASRTALAEAELEYRDDHVSTAAYVKFPVEPASASALLRAAGLAGDGDSERLYALIWTTTPWTLPANRAVAVHSQLDYHVVRLGADLLLMAATRYDAVRQACFPDMTSEILATVPGTALLALRYQNPLLASSGPLSPTAYQPVIHAQFVSADTGTGLVHLAPGHGFEDHQACEEHGVPGTLDPPPIDDEGRFTRDAYAADPERLANRDEIPSVIDGHGAAEAVLRILRDPSHGGGAGLVLHSHRYTHRYPYDWRAGKPVIVRATAQWFADAGGVSESALRALDDVSFVPVAGGRARLEAFVRGRSAWCISRQRAWGVPIPALMDRDTGEAVVDDNTVHHLIQTVERRGTDAWWSDDADDPAWIPQRLRVEGPQQQYVRSMDTMDVWFDSGTSWTHHGVDSSGSPVQADVYLEGSDQHRGWFQSSLLTWVAAAADASSEQSRRPVTAPFRTLITHGFTLDGEGRKMSKSLGNVVSPNQIMDGSLVSAASQLSASKQQQSSSKKKKANTQEAGFGPDALRLWVASSDYTRDVAVSSTALANVHAALIKHRNTIKMLLGCLDTWRSPTTSSTAPVTDALEASEVQGSRDDCSSHNTPARPPSPPALTRRLEHVALLQLRAVMAEVGAHYDAFDFARGVAALNRWIATDLSALYLDAAKDWLYCGTKLQREQALVVVRQMLEGLLRMLAPVTPLVVEEAWEFMPEWIKDDW